MASDPKIQESSGFESKPPGQKTSGGIGEMARPGTIISSSCGEDPHGEEENENIFLKMEPLESNEIEITLVNGGDAKPVFYKEPEHHNNDESDSREEEFDDIAAPDFFTIFFAGKFRLLLRHFVNCP